MSRPDTSMSIAGAASDRGNTVLLWFVSLLLANPVVLFLLFGNIWLSFIAPLAIYLMTAAAWKWTLPKIVRVILINALGIISVCLHAELVFLKAFPQLVIEDLYVFRDGYYFNQSNLDRVFEDKEYKVSYRTNAQGWRIGWSNDPAVVVNSCDWLFVGDSYTQAAQVEFEEMFTSILCTHFPDKVMLNAGVSGFGLPEELKLIKEFGRSLKPSVVFLQICNFNDFMNVTFNARGPLDYLMHCSAFARYSLYDLIYTQPAELPLGRWAEPFHATEQENTDHNIFYLPTSQKKEEDISAFARLLTEINTEVKSIGAELVIIQVPTKEQIHPKFFNEVVDAFHIDTSKLNMLRPNEILSHMCDSLEIERIDLLNAFKKTRETAFYAYDEHLSTHGHRLIADTLFDFITRLFGNTTVGFMSKDAFGDRYPSPWPQQNAVLYQSPRHGNMELFIADSAFQHATRLTYNDVDESHPVAIPYSHRIVYTEGNASSLRTKVVISRIDGSDRHSIISGDDTFGAIPQVSTDGRFVAYAQWRYDRQQESFSRPCIVVCDTAGKEVTHVGTGESDNWRPVFSRDGESLIYISDRDGQYDIFEYNLESKRERRLTSTPYDEWDPNFSPDGRLIVFSARKDSSWDLFEMRRDGVGVVQLTSTRGNEFDPVYSLDGNSILYAGEYGLSRGIYLLIRSYP